jgi:lysophospholipase L1-like esterase
VPRSTQAEFVGEIIATTRLARAHGAEAVVIAPIFGGMRSPSPEALRLADYRAALRSAAAREGVRVLEIPELTEAAFPGNAPFFPVEPIHPGDVGQRVLAEALLRFLDREGILARLGLKAGRTTQ